MSTAVIHGEGLGKQYGGGVVVMQGMEGSVGEHV